MSYSLQIRFIYNPAVKFILSLRNQPFRLKAACFFRVGLPKQSTSNGKRGQKNSDCR